MNKILAVLMLLINTVTLLAQNNSYKYTVHLENVTDDKVLVELIPPTLSGSTAKFSLPRMVPGTYEIYDFGRYVEDLKAVDAAGAVLPVKRVDDNNWIINEPSKVAKITYRVNDTYDVKKDSMPIFEPAGTNFEEANYLLNFFTLIGYFEGKLKQPYEINILHKPDFYGSTSLVDVDATATADKFLLASYNDVADNPVMYCRPDTATVQVGNCEVLVSVYSPNKKSNARYLANDIDTLLQAAGKYLGGKLPVDKYTFLIYLSTHEGITGGAGALEHSFGSVYFLPEMENKEMAQNLRDIAAHEFFHILTPLNIHSVEIADFDYDNPTMSEHLWLYEGTTEYHATASQLKGGIMSLEDFFDNIRLKMLVSTEAYNDTLPFTVMSKGALDVHKEQYANVYEKGALIGLCLDIKLLQLSDGKYGIMNLLKDLSKEYGQDKAFKDDQLFDKIAALTYPEIKTFLQRYVAGNERLPFEELLPLIGVEYSRTKVESKFSLGSLPFYPDPEVGKIRVWSIKNMNAFGKALGFERGDLLLSLNGKKVTPENYDLVRMIWLSTVKEGDKVVVKVQREVNGKSKTVKLKANAFKADVTSKHAVEISKNLNAQQQKLRDAFTGPVRY